MQKLGGSFGFRMPWKEDGGLLTQLSKGQPNLCDKQKSVRNKIEIVLWHNPQ